VKSSVVYTKKGSNTREKAKAVYACSEKKSKSIEVYYNLTWSIKRKKKGKKPNQNMPSSIAQLNRSASE
jgi:uncharacterized protein (DUF2132 family)